MLQMLSQVPSPIQESGHPSGQYWGSEPPPVEGVGVAVDVPPLTILGRGREEMCVRRNV